jgi:hypothetical protein
MTLRASRGAALALSLISITAARQLAARHTITVCQILVSDWLFDLGKISRRAAISIDRAL